MDQREKAERFRELHHAPEVLVLPNAWDVLSALIVADAGAYAVATASHSVAWSRGYHDGEHISRDEMLSVVAAVAAAVEVPVSADLEAGYGDPTGTAEAAIDAGAVGLNIEDGGADADEHVRRVEAVRAAADERGVPLVINARVDVLVRETGDLEEAIRRANLYLGAGADCAFVLGVSDAETIGEVVRRVDGPVSLIANPALPPVAELERLGVARVSLGPATARAAYTTVANVAREVLGQGTFDFLADTKPAADFDRLLP